MNQNPLVILGSARKQSDTKSFLEAAFKDMNFKVADLLDFHVAPYNYAHQYPDDDGFLVIINEILDHKVVVFATPVYWYAMSGLMKTFFDRLTDITTIRKELGRKLAGKTSFLLTVGTHEDLPEGFELPFKLTSEYLKMNYGGYIYYSTKHAQKPTGIHLMAKEFVKQVNQQFISKE